MVIVLVMFGRSAVFHGGSAVFCCRTAFGLEIMHFLDYFHPRNYSFVSCLPLTEHVQSLYWACADIIDPVCDSFDG